jgi:hypothetical protein
MIETGKWGEHVCCLPRAATGSAESQLGGVGVELLSDEASRECLLLYLETEDRHNGSTTRFMETPRL